MSFDLNYENQNILTMTNSVNKDQHPQDKHPQPPYPVQKQSVPGTEDEMQPKADHGEDS